MRALDQLDCEAEPISSVRWMAIMFGASFKTALIGITNTKKTKMMPFVSNAA
jgi:hypothetical protein